MTAVAEPKKAKKRDVVDEPGLSVGLVEETDTVESTEPPKPGDADFDWTKEYPGEKVFTYTTDDGVTIGLAAISKKRQPSIGFMRKTRRKPEFEQILDMLEFIASDNALTVADEWTSEQLVLMWEKWTEWNLANAGE